MHVPVLQKEVLEILSPKTNENFIDCTVGQGGHSNLILERTAPQGRLLAIDADPKQIKNCRENLKKFSERIVLVNDSYANLEKIVAENRFGEVAGILLDLGMSTFQLNDEGRGFTFLRNEPLDMRYDSKNNILTAEEIINSWPEDRIEKIISEYGEEKFSKKIAKKIIEQRKILRIKTTFELAEIIKDATPSAYWHNKIHYATRTFQALRIAVNGELENVEKVLPQAIEILKQDGRLAIISFHSLEDRIVKNFLKQEEKNGKLKLLTKKPLIASGSETSENPRSRSAKLRGAIKL